MTNENRVHTLRKAGKTTNPNDNRHAMGWRNRAAEICEPGVELTSVEIIGMIIGANEKTKPGGRVKTFRWSPTPMKLTKMLRRDDRFFEIKRTSSTIWIRKYDVPDDQSTHLYRSTGMAEHGGGGAPRIKTKKKTME